MHLKVKMTMKFLPLLTTVVLLTPAAGIAQQSWQIDPVHTNAQFAVKHMGISTVRGSFTKTTGTVQYDPSDPSKMAIDVTIDATSIDTRNDRRDNDLRSDHFFDVTKYPTLTFKSKSAQAAGTGKLKVTGDLTIHGVTKQIVLDVDGPSSPLKDGRGNTHMGASASTVIHRSDFGMTGMQAVVGDEITINIDVEVLQPAAQQQPTSGK
jgi:polyisoprenoid-binding protein YceI